VAVTEERPVRAKNWTGSASAPRWYAVAVGLFLGIRAVTTLAAGASFALPGDGWRSVFQLAAVAVLAAGVASPRAARAAVAAVTVTYLLATAYEVSGGATLLGAPSVGPAVFGATVVRSAVAGARADIGSAWSGVVRFGSIRSRNIRFAAVRCGTGWIIGWSAYAFAAADLP